MQNSLCKVLPFARCSLTPWLLYNRYLRAKICCRPVTRQRVMKHHTQWAWHSFPWCPAREDFWGLPSDCFNKESLAPLLVWWFSVTEATPALVTQDTVPCRHLSRNSVTWWCVLQFEQPLLTLHSYICSPDWYSTVFILLAEGCYLYVISHFLCCLYTLAFLRAE